MSLTLTLDGGWKARLDTVDRHTCGLVWTFDCRSNLAQKGLRLHQNAHFKDQQEAQLLLRNSASATQLGFSKLANCLIVQFTEHCRRCTTRLPVAKSY